MKTLLSDRKNKHDITGRRHWIPRMSTVGAECLAASFRSIGIDARVSPPSNAETLSLAARMTTGEECLPQRVVLGNFLRVIRQPDFNVSKTAFFVPTSAGPCRFGQYAPFMKKCLQEMGLEDALVFAPTSSNGYEGISGNVTRFTRTAWRALITADVLRKIFLMIRPYESNRGDAERVMRQSIDNVSAILEKGGMSMENQIRQLVGSIEKARDVFLNVPLKEALRSRPLIGVVGEIYLRLNSFSNQDLMQKVEDLGGECWMADVCEWIWYTNVEQERKLKDAGRTISLEMGSAKIRAMVQRFDEKRLYAPMKAFFQGREEMPVREVLKRSAPYLPQRKALGEMTLNAGKCVAYYEAGCDGVIDISPFTCMNGIVTETYYPTISSDFDDIPIRIFYFDGVNVDLLRDLEIFMELVIAYRQKRLKKSSG